jgi:hypothetical protein
MGIMVATGSVVAGVLFGGLVAGSFLAASIGQRDH